MENDNDATTVFMAKRKLTRTPVKPHTGHGGAPPPSILRGGGPDFPLPFGRSAAEREVCEPLLATGVKLQPSSAGKHLARKMDARSPAAAALDGHGLAPSGRPKLYTKMLARTPVANKGANGGQR